MIGDKTTLTANSGTAAVTWQRFLLKRGPIVHYNRVLSLYEWEITTFC